MLGGVFSIVMVFTPLTSTFSHSQHEAWFPEWDRHGRPRVVIHDRTGLVTAMSAVAYSPAQNSRVDRLLVVSWLGGCSEQVIDLTFEAVEGGYRLSKSVSENGCSFLVGLTRTVALTLRRPVDVSSVQFDASEATVS